MSIYFWILLSSSMLVSIRPSFFFSFFAMERLKILSVYSQKQGLSLIQAKKSTMSYACFTNIWAGLQMRQNSRLWWAIPSISLKFLLYNSINKFFDFNNLSVNPQNKLSRAYTLLNISQSIVDYHTTVLTSSLWHHWMFSIYSL